MFFFRLIGKCQILEVVVRKIWMLSLIFCGSDLDSCLSRSDDRLVPRCCRVSNKPIKYTTFKLSDNQLGTLAI